MITIGIDIGITGAVAAVDSRGSCTVADLPTVPDGKGNRIDGRALILLLRQFVPTAEFGLVLFEDVRPRPTGNGGKQGNTIHSQGSMMRSRGIVEAVIDITRMQRRVVQPQTWKRHYGLIGKDKGDSLSVARALYPLADLRLAKHHNRAEAILIAHFGLDEPAAVPKAGTTRRPQMELVG